MLYLNKGINEHTDGMQLKKKSAIYSYSLGKNSIMKFNVNDDVISLNIKANSLYGLEYINNNNSGNIIINLYLFIIFSDLTPRSIKHEKLLTIKENEFHIAIVFRCLKQFQFDNNFFYNRWIKEAILFKELDWQNLCTYKYKFYNKSGIIEKKYVLLNNHYINLNSIERFVLKSNYNLIFGPGDEFDTNPISTAILGIHAKYFNGISITGSLTEGCYSIRLGNTDYIKDYSFIYYFGDENIDNDDNINAIKGNFRYLSKSWNLQNLIRVILQSNVNWIRTFPNSQLYFGNMFVHECKVINNRWRFTLRSYPKPINCNYKNCYCCEEK